MGNKCMLIRTYYLDLLFNKFEFWIFKEYLRYAPCFLFTLTVPLTVHNSCNAFKSKWCNIYLSGSSPIIVTLSFFTSKTPNISLTISLFAVAVSISLGAPDIMGCSSWTRRYSGLNDALKETERQGKPSILWCLPSTQHLLSILCRLQIPGVGKGCS